MSEIETEVEDRDERPRKKREGGLGVAGFFRNIAEFVRQTIAELRRVVWPTKQQVTTYTAVVMFFVVFMSLLVSLIDLVAGKGVLFIFGS